MVRKIKAKLVLRLREEGSSGRQIAAQGMSRHSVTAVIEAADREGVGWDDVADLDEAAVYQLLFPGRGEHESVHAQPDWPSVHRVLARVGVTLKLLHGEYVDKCRVEGSTAMGYDRFCKTYQKHVLVSGAASRIGHKAGQSIEVDWSGPTMQLTDPVTGHQLRHHSSNRRPHCSGRRILGQHRHHRSHTRARCRLRPLRRHITPRPRQPIHRHRAAGPRRLQPALGTPVSRAVRHSPVPLRTPSLAVLLGDHHSRLHRDCALAPPPPPQRPCPLRHRWTRPPTGLDPRRARTRGDPRNRVRTRRPHDRPRCAPPRPPRRNQRRRVDLARQDTHRHRTRDPHPHPRRSVAHHYQHSRRHQGPLSFRYAPCCRPAYKAQMVGRLI